MLNGVGNENDKNKSKGLISQKDNFALATHFFVHFYDVVLHNYNVKIPIYTSYVGNVVCAHQTFCCLCPCSVSVFSLPLIFTLLTTTISHFRTANFLVFLPTKSVSFRGGSRGRV